MRPKRNNEPSTIDKKSGRHYSPGEMFVAGAATIAAAIGLAACSSPETAASGPSSNETTTSAPASTEESTTVEEQPSESPTATAEQIEIPDISQMPVASSPEDFRPALYPSEELLKYPDYETFTSLDDQTQREHAAKLLVNTLHVRGDTFAQSPDFDFFKNPLNANLDNTAEEIIDQWESTIAIAGWQTVLGENEQIFNADLASEAVTLAFTNVGEDMFSANLLEQYAGTDGSVNNLALHNFDVGSVQSISIEKAENRQGELTDFAQIVTLSAKGNTYNLYFERTLVAVDSPDGSGNQQKYATWRLDRVEA